MWNDNEPTLADIERFSAAVAAAADPSSVMDAASERFKHMGALQRAGDHAGIAEAARTISDASLRLCVAPADNERSAGDKSRFLAIMIRWAWPRYPALGAVLEAARRAELVAWGGKP